MLIYMLMDFNYLWIATETNIKIIKENIFKFGK